MVDNASVTVDDGRRIMNNRTFKATPDYTAPTVFNVGINQSAVAVTSSGLDNAIPVGLGTNLDDGSSSFTGTGGADNSTDNTTTYKDGFGLSDVTAQNLIKNNSSATATWTLTVSAGDITKYIGNWLYFLDQTTLDKIVSVELRLGSDASNYYSRTVLNADLSLLWNWLSDNELLSTWSTTGTPGSLTRFDIIIVTNNATDTFVAGDVVYDILQQWEITDYDKAIQTLSIDESKNTVSSSFRLNLDEGLGFLLDSAAFLNTDATRKTMDLSKYDEDSKGSTDIFQYTFVDRLR